MPEPRHLHDGRHDAMMRCLYLQEGIGIDMACAKAVCGQMWVPASSGMCPVAGQAKQAATSNQPAGEIPEQSMLYKGNAGAPGAHPSQQTTTNCHKPANEVCCMPTCSWWSWTLCEELLTDTNMLLCHCQVRMQRHGGATHHTCLTLQVLEMYYPRDSQGAFYRQTDDVVPQAWMEGMISEVQIRMLKMGAPVDDRSRISKHMYKWAACPLRQ